MRSILLYLNGMRYKIEYPSDESYAISDCILSITGGVFLLKQMILTQSTMDTYFSSFSCLLGEEHFSL